MLLLTTVFSLSGQTTIRNLTIEGKKNGAFLRIDLSRPIDLRNTSGWIRKDNYFYLTIMNATFDSAAIMTTAPNRPVKNFELSQVGESAQFAFELDRKVESFDLYQSEKPPELLVSLRFPITDVLVALQQEKAQSAPEALTGQAAAAAPTDGGMYAKIRTALYLTGASLTIAGVIQQDNAGGLSWEFGTGIGLIGGTYLFDKYIKPLIDD
ncbi:MAG: hypothetical protein ABIA75_04385 [Candidatus Neomarinimicrobiota bacterium]